MATLARLNKRLKHLLFHNLLKQELHFFEENNPGERFLNVVITRTFAKCFSALVEDSDRGLRTCELILLTVEPRRAL